MLAYQSNSSLNKKEIENHDIIHTNGKECFKGFYAEEESYQIVNFISEDERQELMKFYFTKFKEHGSFINGVYSQIPHPINHQLVSDILKNKIYEILGKDTFFYSNVNNDVMCVGDHFYLMTNVYTPHTDAITHIPGFVPYKDIIIPIEIDRDVEDIFYTCKQRFYGRATHFKNQWHDDYFANYANIIKYQSYKEYGVSYLETSSPESVGEWYKKYINGSGVPLSVFAGLSIEKEFSWTPGSAIILDTSVIHGPTNFKRLGARWKLGVVFHTLKKKKNFNFEVQGHETRFSYYTKNLVPISITDLDTRKIPLHLFEGTTIKKQNKKDRL